MYVYIYRHRTAYVHMLFYMLRFQLCLVLCFDLSCVESIVQTELVPVLFTQSMITRTTSYVHRVFLASVFSDLAPLLLLDIHTSNSFPLLSFLLHFELAHLPQFLSVCFFFRDEIERGVDVFAEFFFGRAYRVLFQPYLFPI